MEGSEKLLAIKEAAESKNAKRVYELANEMGYYDVNEIRGTPLNKYRDLFVEGMRATNEGERKDYSSLTKVALGRFPELVRGERIHTDEIKRRLRGIREAGERAGYRVEPYSALKKEEMWERLMRIRREVRSLAERHCPEELSKIDEENERRKRNARENP